MRSLPLPVRNLAALLAALLVLASGCAVNPVTGQQELVLMSEQQELAMGAEYYPQTTQINNGLVPHDPRLQAYVSRVGQRLAAASHRPDIPWEFNVVNSQQVNAFALPGGKISLTRGLLMNMESEDEMASVLAHEIGHVTARHTVAQYTRQAFVSLAVAGLGIALADSDYRQAGLMAAGLAGGLLMLSYNRDQERQADQLGYEYMVRNGYNPQGQVETFEIFQGLQKREPGFIEAMLASHPLTSERIGVARRRVAQSPPGITRQPLKERPFDRALAIQRRRQPAYAAMEKGDELYRKKRYQAAAAKYRRAMRIYPDDGLFGAKLALAENQRDRGRAALAAAARGAEASPGVFLPQFVAGAVHYKHERLNRAARYLERARRLLPAHQQSTLLLGATYERLGQRRSAVNAYRQVVRSAPRSDEARAARARLQAMGVR
jgi:predicted Zn-dependent protease